MLQQLHKHITNLKNRSCNNCTNALKLKETILQPYYELMTYRTNYVWGSRTSRSNCNALTPQWSTVNTHWSTRPCFYCHSDKNSTYRCQKFCECHFFSYYDHWLNMRHLFKLSSGRQNVFKSHHKHSMSTVALLSFAKDSVNY